MCGILGYYGDKIKSHCIVQRLVRLSHRGREHYGITDGNKTEYGLTCDLNTQWHSRFFLAHALHAIVDFLPQPLGNSFAANCEIYNWKELALKHGIEAKNDAELLYHLLKRKGLKILDEVDGDYAFAWMNEDRLIIARDIIGVKPLWWHQDGKSLWFASENKAIDGKGCLLDPRKILVIENGIISFSEREFPQPNEHQYTKNETTEKIATLLEESVKKRIAGLDKVAILFSGGVDSTTLAVIAKKMLKDITLYTAGTENSEDVIWAQRIARELNLSLRTYICTNEDIANGAKEVMHIIETSDVMKVSVALPFHFACKLAHEDRYKVILSGLGSEELFAGYQRHKLAKNINKECYNGLLAMHERDLFRDDAITMSHQLELRFPFLDRKLIDFALSIPGSLKITQQADKAVLREAALLLGVPLEVAYRKKRAAQYGSGIDKVLAKLAKVHCFHTKKEYLKKIGQSPSDIRQ